jgi:alkyldihydroxyacetonephosphate synthase
MRRWNGWGDDSVLYPLPEGALARLVEWVGESSPPKDASLEEVVREVPTSRLPTDTMITTDPEARIRHARGQSLPDWVALRSGRIGALPDGVAFPESEEEARALIDFAARAGAQLIPYGGGTSVVGHINPLPDAPATLTVSLARMNRLFALDEVSQLATFGAGATGPVVEAALRARGYTLGHFPQSFELSTLGGWIATRSSGQQALWYGRPRDFFIGGRMLAPAGVLDLPIVPASAAGPDWRHLVLGSEGRLGIITQATVRVRRLPTYENFHAVFFHTWEEGVEAVRAMVQARLPLSMLRLSDPVETETTLVLAGHERLIEGLHSGLKVMGFARPGKTMLFFAATGDETTVRRGKRGALRVARQYGGLHVGQYMGEHWRRGRFRSPYLRNTLWEHGYAIDTLETAFPWSRVLEAVERIRTALEQAQEEMGERVHVMVHLSHMYEIGASLYVTLIFRVLPDPGQMLAFWHRLKDAASQAIVEEGGTISHQHGVGIDHKPYLESEKGALGMALLADVARRCDPDGILNPGKLF